MEQYRLSLALEYEPAGQMEYTLSLFVEHFDTMKNPGGHVTMLLHLVHPISEMLLQGDVKKYPIGQSSLHLAHILL